jgi:hypothetical protein
MGKIRLVLTDESENRRLQREAMSRPLPRWSQTAQALRAVLCAG